MDKAGKILSIIMILALLLLYSASPALAEEIDGSTGADAGVGTEEPAETPEETPDIEEPADQGANVEEPADPTGSAGEGLETEEPVTEGAETQEPVTEGAEAEKPAAEPVEELAGEEAAPAAEGSSGAAAEDVYNVNVDSAVLEVMIPSTVSITIDPFELAGRGQIYSDIYEIGNYGDADVLLTFTDIQVTFADDENFESLAGPFDESSGSELKSIYLQLDFGRDDVPSAVLTGPGRAGGISIPLASAQTGTDRSFVSLSFSGSVNHLPEVAWQDGDVKISMTYSIDAVPPPVKTDIQLLTATPEAIEDTPESTAAPEAIEEMPESAVTPETIDTAAPESQPPEPAGELPPEGLPEGGTITEPQQEPGSTGAEVPPEATPPKQNPSQETTPPDQGLPQEAPSEASP